MSANLEALVIFDEELYRTGHMANRWMHLLVQHFTDNARMLAPERSGELKAGIHGEAEAFPATKTMIGTIASDAPHSLYVLGGTTGPIMSAEAWASGGMIHAAYEYDENGRRVGKPGYWLPVGRRPWPPVRYRFVVSGQAANNFMVKAWRRTSHQHSVLRGAIPDIIQRF